MDEFLNWHRTNKYYICKRLRMLEYLKSKGFLPIRTEPDIKNPKYSIWIFENSSELMDNIEQYLVQQADRTKEKK